MNTVSVTDQDTRDVWAFRCRRARRDRKWSQRDLAAAANVSGTLVQRLELGLSKVGGGTRHKIARALGAPEIFRLDGVAEASAGLAVHANHDPVAESAGT
jgi:transcriptional regulator with XRE-family HTH domain